MAALLATVLPTAGDSVGAQTDQCDPRLTWSGFEDGVRDIIVADADGTNRSSLSDEGSDPDPDDNNWPDWSPDGVHIAWSGEDASGGQQIYTAMADGSGTRLEVAKAGPDPDPVNNRQPAWSPDGTRLAWNGDDGTTSQIYVANADGSARSVLSQAGDDPDPDENAEPAWSPDGNQIAWTDSNVGELWVADADGANRRPIAMVGDDPRPMDNAEPEWSPDGAQIVWEGWDGASTHIYAADPEGADLLEISTVSADPDPTNNEAPTWSPDGLQIAWSGEDESGNRHIYVADADGTNRRTISDVGTDPDPVDNTQPTWAPDGRMIAWAGAEGATTEIYVADLNGFNREAVSTAGPDPDPTLNERPDWQPRWSQVEVRQTAIDLPEGGTGSMTIEVTNVGECDATNVTIAGLNLPCLPSPPATPSGGSFFEGTWRIGGLAAGATVELTLGGPVSGDPDADGCLGEAEIINEMPRLEFGATRSFPIGQTRRCPDEQPPFTDTPTTGDVAADIACIYGLGITQGTTATTYGPAEPVTRQQMASFLARIWRDLDGACPEPVTPFTDTPTTGSIAADIACIYGLGITQGTTDTTYGPAETVTRGQMARFLARVWRALDGACPTDPTPLTDVTGSLVPDVECIYGLGITQGTTATTYAPAEPVTRQQMASFLARIWREALATRLAT